MGLGWLAATLVLTLAAPPGAPHGAAGCTGVRQGAGDRAMADAIAAVPSLSTFSGGIGAAGLTDELNRRPRVTVFAPTDEALRELPGPVTLETSILLYHMVPQRLAAENLIGTHQTLHGATLSVVRSGSRVLVNAAAGLICQRVRAANGSVYLVDAPLTPR
jgi:uncharacterized surface protein with fasciclin (FAS1) repeats